MTDNMLTLNNNITPGSNRVEDGNGYIHIKECVLTGAEVAEYLGREIQGYANLGLDEDEIVCIYRPIEEIEKAAETFNCLPLTDNHIPISPERPNQSKWLGCTGSESVFKNNKLYNTVSLWTQRAKDYVSLADQGNGGKKDLSCGYAYDLVPEEGLYNGMPYKFKMVNIRGNHVALVEVGRNEDAMIADSKIVKENNRVKKTLTQILLGAFIGDTKKQPNSIEALKSILAMDSAEFPGGAEAQLENVRDLLNHMAKDEEGRQVAFAKKEIIDEDPEEKKAEDEEEEEKEKEAKDEDPDDKKAEDEEEEEKKEKAMDSAIRTRDKVIQLCNSVVGKMSDQFIADSSPEQMIQATLKKFNLNTNGKSLEAKVAMLETLAATKKTTKKIATDSKVSSDYKSLIPNRKA